MELKVKFFDDLTTRELYGILQARSAIFVVEQSCIYQDIDWRDQQSLHVFYEDDGQVRAYLRAFRKDEHTVQMGRVLTVKHGTGLGGSLLAEGIRQVKAVFNPKRIRIEAQCYAVGFYEREGFRTCSEPFMDDGIPHVEMVLEVS